MLVKTECLTNISQYFGNFAKAVMRLHNKTFFSKVSKVLAEFSKVFNLKSSSFMLCQNLFENSYVPVVILAPFTRYRITYVSDSFSCRITVLFTRLRTNPIRSSPEIRYNSLCRHSTPERFLHRIHKKWSGTKRNPIPCKLGLTFLNRESKPNAYSGKFCNVSNEINVKNGRN